MSGQKSPADKHREEVGHTINPDGTIHHFSVSNVELGDPRAEGGCIRRFWYKNVGGKKEEEKAKSAEAKAAGTKLHDELKHYLKTGEKVLGPLAMKGLHFVPPPGPDLIVEQGIHTATTVDGVVHISSPLTAAGIPFVGYIDLAHRRAINYGADDPEDTIDPPGTIAVIDWKRKGSAKNRDGGSTLLRPDQLIRTVQMLGYGEFVRRAGFATNYVRLGHGYFPAKDGAPRMVSKLHTVDEFEKGWDYVEGLGRTLVHVVKETVAEKVPANLKACGAYGGCPMRGFCTAAQATSLSSLFGESEKEALKMGLLDQLDVQPQPDIQAQLAKEEATLKAQAAIQQQNTNAGLLAAWHTIVAAGRGFPTLGGEAARAFAAANNTQAPSAGFAGAGQLSAITIMAPAQILQLAGELSGAPAIPAPPPPVVAAMAQVAAPMPGFSILPPDAPPSNPMLASRQPDGVPTTVISTPTEPMPAPPSTEAVSEPPKKKRGRPKASESAPSQVVTQTASSPTSAAVQTAGDDLDLEVFVDCIPNGDFMSLNAYADKICKALADRYCFDEKGQPTISDIRCAPSTSPIGFGKWEGAVHALVVENPPKNDTYVLDTRGNRIAEIVADAMRVVCLSRNALYVRGIR